ncbi:hypothetical protein, partial [Paenibacillus sonchi]|uniref:hypothetical protein n=1 Tax=Paenibacillus sonchi TaxID=373687 RepID=UPI001ADEC971
VIEQRKCCNSSCDNDSGGSYGDCFFLHPIPSIQIFANAVYGLVPILTKQYVGNKSKQRERHCGKIVVILTNR